MPFLFSISNEKTTALMPILCQQNVLSPKTHYRHSHILLKKKYIFSKTQCSNVIFFQFFRKNLCCQARIWSKRRSRLFKLHHSIGQKSQKDAPFFPIFLKKYLLSCPYFVKKRPFSQKICFFISFFSIFL